MMTAALHMSINNNMQLMICSSDRSFTSRVGSLGVPPRDTPPISLPPLHLIQKRLDCHVIIIFIIIETVAQ